MVAVNSGYIDRDILKQALFLSTTEWDSYLDLPSEASITPDGNVQLATTDTGDAILLVTWLSG